MRDLMIYCAVWAFILTAFSMCVFGTAKKADYSASAVKDEEITEGSDESDLKAVFDCYKEVESEQETSKIVSLLDFSSEESGEILQESFDSRDEDEAEMETEGESEESVTDMVGKVYTIAGKRLREDIYDYLESKLTEAGIPEWLPMALCQCHQESGFNPMAEASNGLDKGILQYRTTYWDYAKADIFDWRAQIDRYVEQVANRLRSGCTVEETISRHYTSDYVTAVDEEYVADVLSWMSRLEVE